ncbi:hypothetical protein J3R82DRAFT_10423 [Butyriboletus roseoflavus]|nr:hypothetical protein J3R82DRAFT_10423 [Butyriboletus roseoflavus]
MTDSISYPPTPVSTYIPPASYYPQSHAGGHVHVVAPPQPRSEPQQRKRPKYTRSKTGCLTCRVKKIKCDETKPICMRCTHGQRDCTWPEGVPTRKKATPRKESVDGRPSTAESSGLSETSTPPTRDSTPPRRPQSDYSLPPVVARRHSEPFAPPLGPDPELARRQIAPHQHPYQLHHPSQTNVLSMIPEMPYQSRYDSAYSGTTSMHTGTPRLPGGHSHQSSHSLQMRSMTHQHQSQHQSQHQHQHHQHQQPPQHWTQPHQMLPPLNPMEPYFHTPQERNLVGHSSNDHHPRYQ